MSRPARDKKAAVEAAKSAAGNLSEAGKTAVLEHLLSEMSPKALKALSSDAQGKLLQALASTEAAPSATQSQAGGRIETVDGHQAVVGKILVNDIVVTGQHLDTLLSEGSFNKTRAEQIAYAKKLGYRLATREENLAYVNGLLEKAADGSINVAEANALEIYITCNVRDIRAGLVVRDRRVKVFDLHWPDLGKPRIGALFVRASAESK